MHRRYSAIVSLTAEFLDAALRPGPSRHRGLDEPVLSELGVRRVRVPEPSSIPLADRTLSTLDEVTPDCRDGDSCDPVERAIDHALELLALDRAEEALAMLEPHLEAHADDWMLRETEGRLLAAQGRYSEAAAAFEAERVALMGKTSAFGEASRARAGDWAGRARALAATVRD